MQLYNARLSRLSRLSTSLAVCCSTSSSKKLLVNNNTILKPKQLHHISLIIFIELEAELPYHHMLMLHCQHMASQVVIRLKMNEIVYGQLWLYFFVLLIYFGFNLGKEEYTGAGIMSTELGINCTFGSYCFYWIFTASIVSITLGCTTLLDLFLYPPSYRTLNKRLLCASLFLPAGIVVAFAANLQTHLPILAFIIHTSQVAICTTCVLDFLRRAFPTTFTDRLTGCLTSILLVGILCAQIGFGGYRTIAKNAARKAMMGSYLALLVFMVYKFMHDVVAVLKVTSPCWERSIVHILVGSWVMLFGITTVVGIRHDDTTTYTSVDIILSYWSGIVFAVGVFVAARYQSNVGKEGRSKLETQLEAETVANEVKYDFIYCFASHHATNPPTTLQKLFHPVYFTRDTLSTERRSLEFALYVRGRGHATFRLCRQNHRFSSLMRSGRHRR